jgi:hypothetical protein
MLQPSLRKASRLGQVRCMHGRFFPASVVITMGGNLAKKIYHGQYNLSEQQLVRALMPPAPGHRVCKSASNTRSQSQTTNSGAHTVLNGKQQLHSASRFVGCYRQESFQPSSRTNHNISGRKIVNNHCMYAPTSMIYIYDGASNNSNQLSDVTISLSDFTISFYNRYNSIAPRTQQQSKSILISTNFMNRNHHLQKLGWLPSGGL